MTAAGPVWIPAFVALWTLICLIAFASTSFEYHGEMQETKAQLKLLLDVMQQYVPVGSNASATKTAIIPKLMEEMIATQKRLEPLEKWVAEFNRKQKEEVERIRRNAAAVVGPWEQDIVLF